MDPYREGRLAYYHHESAEPPYSWRSSLAIDWAYGYYDARNNQTAPTQGVTKITPIAEQYDGSFETARAKIGEPLRIKLPDDILGGPKNAKP